MKTFYITFIILLISVLPFLCMPFLILFQQFWFYENLSLDLFFPLARLLCSGYINFCLKCLLLWFFFILTSCAWSDLLRSTMSNCVRTLDSSIATTIWSKSGVKFLNTLATTIWSVIVSPNACILSMIVIILEINSCTISLCFMVIVSKSRLNA